MARKINISVCAACECWSASYATSIFTDADEKVDIYACDRCGNARFRGPRRILNDVSTAVNDAVGSGKDISPKLVMNRNKKATTRGLSGA